MKFQIWLQIFSCIFLCFLQFFESFSESKSFAHSFWAKWANRSGRSGQMSDHERFAQVAQKEWAIVSKSLRSLTFLAKNEWCAPKFFPIPGKMKEKT